MENGKHLNLSADFLTDLESFLLRYVKQNDQEFFPAPADHLMLAAVSLQNVLNTYQSQIPGIMAIGIVYFLEIIYIGKDQDILFLLLFMSCLLYTSDAADD